MTSLPLPFDSAPLGELSARQFMQQHWQKKWRLIKNAIPSFTELVDQKAIFALACKPEVESRLIIKDGADKNADWTMEHGPFTPQHLKKLPKTGWTLLIQGLNLHVPAADRLLRRFSFLPYARLDDVMVSLAAPGGGVGPHFDSYDVFLLQGMGTRRWQLSEQSDLEIQPDRPLKILANMRATETLTLTSGDMLYLPPHVAHDGVAMQSEGFCTTYSIGFRAPTHQEIGDAFLDWIGATSKLDGRIADPDLQPTSQPARIPKRYQREVIDAITKLGIDRSTMAQFAGCFASETKPNVEFTPPEEPLERKPFATNAAKVGVRFDAGTICLYDDEFLFINGDAFTIQGDRHFWQRLADHRGLPPDAFSKDLNAETIDALYDWYCNGILHLNAKT